jgi:hypothetical protein
MKAVIVYDRGQNLDWGGPLFHLVVCLIFCNIALRNVSEWPDFWYTSIYITLYIMFKPKLDHETPTLRPFATT